MDVVCSRCKSEYEFDDALISRRGTTVRCTACGLQFKVYAEGEDITPDLWRVYHPANPRMTQQDFETLARLQHAIVEGRVTSQYMLVRGESSPRSLSDILELQALLRQRKSERPTSSLGRDTLIHQMPVDELIVPSNPPEPIDDAGSEYFTRSTRDGRDVSSGSGIRSALSAHSDPAKMGFRGYESTGQRPALIARPPSLRQRLSSTQVEQLEISPEGSLPPSAPGMLEMEAFPGRTTPRKVGLLSFRRAFSRPVSSRAGGPISRHARSGGVVVSVVVGATAFLAFANRSRILDFLRPPDRGGAAVEEPRDGDLLLQKKLQNEEIRWVRRVLFRSPVEPGEGDAILAELVQELSDRKRQKSWQFVDVLRAQGRFVEARVVAGTLSPVAPGPVSLSLLDLAESPASPPWPLILERLKEASSGERGRFFARTLYIYSLLSSGQSAKARADFEAFSRIKGAQESPLFHDLKGYLDAQVVGLSEDPSRTPQVRSSTSAPPKLASQPSTATLNDPFTPGASLAKASRADGLWEAGHHVDALILYHEVVNELGTRHTLGERAAERISQAARLGKEKP